MVEDVEIVEPVALTSVILFWVSTDVKLSKKKRKHKTWVNEYIGKRDMLGTFNGVAGTCYCTEIFSIPPHEHPRISRIVHTHCRHGCRVKLVILGPNRSRDIRAAPFVMDDERRRRTNHPRHLSEI